MINSFRNLLIMLLLLAGHMQNAASQSTTVERASFSMQTIDDYSPVYFRDGLVFCSTRNTQVPGDRARPDQLENSNIWYVPLGDTMEPGAFFILAEELNTVFHDGPVTFSTDGLEIIYSRNLDVDSRHKDVFDTRNQLGLFTARWINGTWSDITSFPYNNKKYSNTTPALSADGERIYFASDMPGGYGGADLWYCERSEAGWLPPVNLGAAINSRGNESYPFVNGDGVLYFASDGWPGFGKKDIFLSYEVNEEWAAPVHLDAHINSRDDDFGLVTDRNGREGYFSSNREKQDDIYHFVSLFPPLYKCESLMENYYCYHFNDEGIMEVENLYLSYEWVFGDGSIEKGNEVEHCFPGAGKYTVELHIIDNNTGNTFFTQSSFEVDITDAKQPYINSPDAILKKTETVFDALRTNLPDMEVEEYYWDFGDGTRLSGVEVEHAFQKTGNYMVQLGVRGRPDSTGMEPRACVFKVVTVLQDNQELAMHQDGGMELSGQMQEAGVSRTFYTLKEAQAQDAVFRVELLSSDSRISIDSSLFDPLRGEYDIKEVFLRKDSLYSYTVGEASTVLGTYEVYDDVVDRGFENARVKSYILADLAEEELLQLTSDLENFSDAYFEFDDYRIGEASYPILDQVVDIMNRYPSLGLEIAAHTDNMGSFEYNTTLSQRRAQSMVDYLVLQGIETSRLIGKGYGESRPITPNTTEEGKMLNRRVEFIIIETK